MGLAGLLRQAGCSCGAGVSRGGTEAGWLRHLSARRPGALEHQQPSSRRTKLTPPPSPAAALPQSSGFTHLVLANNQLDDTSVVDIVAALRYNSNLQLQFLDLGGNCIFGPGAKGISELLQDNRWAAGAPAAAWGAGSCLGPDQCLGVANCQGCGQLAGAPLMLEAEGARHG